MYPRSSSLCLVFPSLFALTGSLACGDPLVGPPEEDTGGSSSSSGGDKDSETEPTSGGPIATTDDEPTSTGATTTATSSDDTTGEPVEPPDLMCPGDPSGLCDASRGQLEAGAAVLSIIPNCWEQWLDKDMNSEYKKGNDELFDCGCDRVCPGDEGYEGPDEGEGDGKLQPSYMAGFGHNRPANGVRGEATGLVGEGDGLWARGIVMRQGDTTVAIVTLDTVGWFNGDVLTVRGLLADAGHDIDHLVVHAIHNHEGPDSMGMWGEDLFTPGYDPKYREQLHTTVVELVGAALADARPVEGFKIGEVDISTFHENGVANVISDHRDPWVVDEMIGAAHLVDGDGETIATLINFGCHPETMADENLLFTADFVHSLRRTVEKGSVWQTADGKPGLGGPAIYLNGAVGGMMTTLGVVVTNPDGDTYGGGYSWEKTDSIGQLLGEMALEAVALGDDIADPQLRVINKRWRAPVVNSSFKLLFEQGIVEREVFINEDTQKQEIETEMSLIEVGPLQILTIPGELLPELAIGGYDGSHVNAPNVEFIHADNENPPDVANAPEGPYIKDRMTGTYRWLIGLGNDELGYIIPAYDFQLADSMPWVNEAPGNHYEETNSLGPDMAALVDSWTDYLLWWSAQDD
jgi:hypothetical protein